MSLKFTGSVGAELYHTGILVLGTITLGGVVFWAMRSGGVRNTVLMFQTFRELCEKRSRIYWLIIVCESYGFDLVSWSTTVLTRRDDPPSCLGTLVHCQCRRCHHTIPTGISTYGELDYVGITLNISMYRIHLRMGYSLWTDLWVRHSTSLARGSKFRLYALINSADKSRPCPKFSTPLSQQVLSPVSPRVLLMVR